MAVREHEPMRASSRSGQRRAGLESLVSWRDRAAVDQRIRAASGADLRGCLERLREGDPRSRTCLSRALEELANQPSHAEGGDPSTPGTDAPARPELVGLVLSGGGGKGAYEVGCWCALRELGIQPSVITGTSVGGLNAALIAQGDQRTARELWGSIASRQVFRWRRLASPLVLILRLGFIAGSPKVAGGRRRWETLEPVLEASSLTYLLMMTLVGLFSLPDWARAPWNLHLSPAQGVWAYALMVAWNVVTVVLLDALVVTPPIIWHLLERRDLFVLDNGPLKQTLAEHLDAATVARAPQLVLVTSASQVEYFDPDRPELVRVGGRSGAPHYRPAFETRFHPHYATLNAKTEAEIEDLLVRTSSLPFGIFPRATRLEGGCRGTLDGGVADNTPLLPMLRLGLERIVIIHLRRPGGRRRTSPRRRLSVLAALDAAVVQAALDLERLTRRAPESEAAYRSFVAEHGQLLSYFEWLRLPVGRRAERPVWALPELIHIVPSKRLGGLLTGTLRFSGRKSRKLMRLGYADTLQAFREQG